MEEEGIVASDCLPLEPRFPLPRDQRLGVARCRRRWCLSDARCKGGEAPAGENPGQQSRATIPFTSMSSFSLHQIDEDVEVPQTSENPLQSFEIHNIFYISSQLLALIIYMI